MISKNALAGILYLNTFKFSEKIVTFLTGKQLTIDFTFRYLVNFKSYKMSVLKDFNSVLKMNIFLYFINKLHKNNF